MRWLALSLLLASCMVPEAREEDRYILVATGGFAGATQTRISSDDRVTETHSGGLIKRPDTIRTVPGAYQRVLAVVEAEGQAIAGKVIPDGAVCMDYGTDSLRIVPPLELFDMVIDDCPNDALLAFVGRALGAVEP